MIEGDRILGFKELNDKMNRNVYKKILFQGYSMYPFLLPGDILLVKRYALEEIMPGDIIVYQDSNKKKNVAHRAVQINPLKIKGDNLTVCDDMKLSESDVVGKVNSIERRDKIFPIDSFVSKCVAFLSTYNCTQNNLCK